MLNMLFRHHLGYLAEIEEQNLMPALDRLIEGSYTVEDRMMLRGSVCVDGQQIASDIALNDIVLNRSGNLRHNILPVCARVRFSL